MPDDVAGREDVRHFRPEGVVDLDAPARIDDALEPEGATPRSLNDSAVLGLQGELLSRLAEAAA